MKNSTEEQKKAGNLLRLLIPGGLVIILLSALLSAYLGYHSGISKRTAAQVQNDTAYLQEQFNLGVQDIETGNWDLARQRFEYIIRQNPDFPGAADQLVNVVLHLNTTATPTVSILPTLTPTPDTRGVEDRFAQAEQLLANNDWNGTIDTLLLLRKDDPQFRTVQIDGLLFLALRNRGMDKIGKQADLEGGIYDLALAERFGPLDTEAQSYLNWARIYITGASFWEVNWEEAVNYFSQIAPQLPYLRDGSGLTSMERYRLALIGLGKSLMQTTPCKALEPFQLALSIAPDDETSKALEEAATLCETGVGKEKKKDRKTQEPTLEPAPTAYPPPGP